MGSRSAACGARYIEAMDSALVRLMRVADLQSAKRASDDVFNADRRSRRVSEPEIKPRSEAASKRWIDRMRFFLTVDPQGCWVAANGDEIIGFATSQNRGPFWYLAT